jgi:hypothetical protein
VVYLYLLAKYPSMQSVKIANTTAIARMSILGIRKRKAKGPLIKDNTFDTVNIHNVITKLKNFYQSSSKYSHLLRVFEKWSFNSWSQHFKFRFELV